MKMIPKNDLIDIITYGCDDDISKLDLEHILDKWGDDWYLNDSREFERSTFNSERKCLIIRLIEKSRVKYENIVNSVFIPKHCTVTFRSAKEEN